MLDQIKIPERWMVEPKKWNERSHATLTSFLNVHIRFSFLFFFFIPNLQIKSRFISIFYLSRKKNRSFFFSHSFLIKYGKQKESRLSRGWIQEMWRRRYKGALCNWKQRCLCFLFLAANLSCLCHPVRFVHQHLPCDVLWTNRNLKPKEKMHSSWGQKRGVGW